MDDMKEVGKVVGALIAVVLVVPIGIVYGIAALIS